MADEAILSADELAAIHKAWQTYAGPLEPAIQHVRALLAEVERLRAENAALREIATPIAYGAVVDQYPAYGPMLFHVGTNWPALKAQARALLGTDTSA